MFGVNIQPITLSWDVISWIVAITVTIYVAVARIPFEKGTDDYQALRLCRISLVLVLWSFNSGLIGLALAVAAFILAIIAIVKGRALYGTILIISSICVPLFGFIHSVSTVFK